MLLLIPVFTIGVFLSERVEEAAIILPACSLINWITQAWGENAAGDGLVSAAVPVDCIAVRSAGIVWSAAKGGALIQACPVDGRHAIF